MSTMSTGTFIGLLAICAVAQCQLFDALYTYVLDKAANTSIPVVSSREPVNVSIGMSLIQLTSLDSKSGDAEIETWMSFRWTDTRLSWDPTTFNDTAFIRLPLSRIWNPDVMLYNGHTSNIEPLTVVDASGGVMYFPPTTLKTRCYVGNYTKDGSVTCRFKYGSWVYDGFLLNVIESSNEVDLSNYESDETEWELTKQKVERRVTHYACCEQPFPDVVFTLKFKEKGKRNSVWNIFD
ncbi:acetylcholine receptor subunit alpha-type acr-16-like [Haliotis rubra]|uniref:acetylcholine receptor subunit alpha-type acr-16-like n=1 Tax=Haliotis rubra TaxID=36100 RepID=UPI001EE59091|nr:acetylcholine receptor subunit alpha-type acr-16-like [Haliotis rubra]XP_046560453.1 acetylcholine receptor subunit alpha-type acr-16-like [Haliotis rubra]